MERGRKLREQKSAIARLARRRVTVAAVLTTDAREAEVAGKGEADEPVRKLSQYSK